MPLLLWTLLLGLVTYWVISRSFTHMSNRLIWVLWLVVMTPVLVFSLWILVQGEQPPPAVLMGLLIICPLLYTGMILASASSVKARKTKPDDQTLDHAQADHAQEQAKQSPTDTAQDQPKEPTKPITRDEETLLQRCFPWSIYYLQNIEYRPQAMICKGKLKTSPGKAYQAVQKNVESSFGDRFLVLFQEGLNGTPFFALVPNPQAHHQSDALGHHQPEKKPKNRADMVAYLQAERVRRLNQTPLTRPALTIALAIATLITTTLVGVTFIPGVEDPQALQENPALIRQGLAYGLSLMVILGVHESGHYLATRYHKLKATLPYFIPVPFFLGTLGAFIQMRSPMPNRKALFDVGIAGPLAGLAVSLPILLWGLAHSSIVPLGAEPALFNFEALDPSRSIILLIMSKLALGSTLQADSALQLHPVAISGCLGLIVTALNLMPVGQLDGGHIVHAMYGQRTAAIVSQVARLLMWIVALIYSEFLLWAILLLFIPAAEPALNDVSELDSSRDLLGLLALTLLVLIILPAPAALLGLVF
ncbi:MAG: site-2 protease family protein [Phormidesmis sp. RL_2_1]|nr:site-2 protease family protein [Phormidesmis sp. RL_2_1]